MKHNLIQHMKSIRNLIIAVLTLLTCLPAAAVTDREMDEARAITAKMYLRYVNNGSGYLDEFSVKSMSELNGKLKAKEKENIKAFNAVKVPSDYASWDKEKLVEFWAVTFFTSPGLDKNGLGARSRVRKQIQAMSVSAPAAPQAAQKDDAAVPQPVPAASPAVDSAMPSADAAAQEQEDILSDQKAIEKDAEEAIPATPQEQSHTWVYVLVLAILVAVVIWLVVYAANLMKRQPTGEESADGSDTAELRKQAREAITRKNEEIDQLHQRLQAEEGKSAALGMELEHLRVDLSRAEDTIARLREENMSLSRKEEAPRPAAPRAEERQPEPARKPRPERKPEPEEAPVLRVIYLGRANNRGIFVRADRRINVGNTIFRLDTNDGLVGTFHVVDEPEVVDVALSDPSEYLGNGCTGEDFGDTAGVTRIVTDSAGTAIFENGYWKVLRKTRVHYE